MNPTIRDLLRNIREVMVLLATDQCDLYEQLMQGIRCSLPPLSTADRIVLAAEALGLAKRQSHDTFVWSDGFKREFASKLTWNLMVSLMRQQMTYLNLANQITPRQAQPFLFDQPRVQVKESPQSYLEFLQGVDASHQAHALWFATLDAIREKRHLVDIGCGLGTFTKAWLKSDVNRTATLIDLPGVHSLVDISQHDLDSRTEYVSADICDLDWSCLAGDVYLLSNVLHLLPTWQDVLCRVAKYQTDRSLIAILEAAPDSSSGALFDLQVHLRSGCRGGLLLPQDIDRAIESLGFSTIHLESNSDPSDPFDRYYTLWLASKRRIAG